MSPHQIAEVLLPLRRNLLKNLLHLAFVAAIPALITGVVASVAEGAWIILVVDIAAYAATVLAYIVLKYRYRLAAGIFVGALLLLSTALLFTVGTLGATALWLTATVVFAFVLLEPVYGFIVFAVTLLTVLVTTILMPLGYLPWEIPFYGWLAVVGSFIGITIFIGSAITYLSRRLAASVLQEQFLSREVQHRVRNNLQLMESLLGIESRAAISAEATATLELMADRVSAIGHAFASIESTTERILVQSESLFRGLVVDQQQRGRPPVTLAFREELGLLALDQASPLAVILAEVFNYFNIPSARLTMTIRPAADSVDLDIVDDATAARGVPGEPDTFLVPEIQRQIMDALISQIEGTLTIQHGHVYLHCPRHL